MEVKKFLFLLFILSSLSSELVVPSKLHRDRFDDIYFSIGQSRTFYGDVNTYNIILSPLLPFINMSKSSMELCSEGYFLIF